MEVYIEKKSFSNLIDVRRPLEDALIGSSEETTGRTAAVGVVLGVSPWELTVIPQDPFLFCTGQVEELHGD